MLKLLKHLRPFTLAIILALALLFFHSLSELFLPTLMAEIVDEGVVKGDTSFILQLGGLMLLVAAGGTLANIFASY
ncbi:MAG TPA: multidrug ABC transporter ATP-binding protein, partial [Paenibacillaceae bacterium]|nr:multidrug ABC transporter ATP-binding protein [Paenibacillaceae bacterium]